MKKILIGCFVLIILLIVGLIALPSLVPSDVYKEKIETQLTQELGRKVSVLGEVKLSAFPVIKAKAGRVEIDNPAGFTADKFVTMDGLDARVKLWPLLSKQVEIASFALQKPEINLEKNTQGQVNWAFGDAPTEPKPDAGPFKRDGRYSAVDPAIGKFSLTDGTISYADRVSGAEHNLNDVNVDFALSSLAAPLKLDGDLTYNGTPATVSLSLNSIRNFLDGKETPLSGSLETAFADIGLQGNFLTGQDIQFDVNVDGKVSEMSKLTALIPQEMPYANLINSADIKGDYRYENGILSAKDAKLNAKGDSFDAAFDGNATLAETPVLDGRVTLDASDIATLAKALDQNIKGLELLKTAKVSADFTAQDKGFAANNIEAVLNGDGLAATYKGAGSFGDAISATGKFTGNIADVQTILSALDMDILQAAAVKSIDASGDVSFDGTNTTLSNIIAKTSGGALSGEYKGNAKILESGPSANGEFKIDIPSAPALNTAADLKIDAMNALGALAANGQINMSGKTISLSALTASVKDGTLQGQYTGSATIGEVPSYDGAFEGTLPSLTAFASQSGMTVPYASSIGKINVKGRVSGAGQAITLTGLNAALTEGQINGTFTGQAAMKDGVNLSGDLSADIPSLRAIAQTAGTPLPQSTDTGVIYERFSVSGKVTGTPANITFKNANILLDDLKGQGDFTVDMTKAKPFVTGIMNMEGLDLRPYMAAYSAQNPTGEIQPWSQEPINMAFLKSVDGDFSFNTPNIVTDRISLQQSNMSAKLRNGVMTADLPNMLLYGGKGRMEAILDGSGSIPSVSLDLNLNGMISNRFLSAVAGFTNATGTTGTALKIRGSGRSQAEIMKSLSGGGDFKMVDGQISGVDLEQMLTGLDQALTSRSLPSGIGASYVTKFNDIIGLFKVQNGVASIGDFSLRGAGVLAEGAGNIDLGNQKIDFSLRPRLTGKNANELAAFGIPIKVTGGFGDVAVGLDSDLLGQIVAERARVKAASLIKEQVGGSVGDILGGVIGGGRTQQQGPIGNTPSQTQQPTTPPKSDEQVVTDLLGGFLGGKKETSSPSPELKKEETKEPSVEDTLLGIFGGKKKKKEGE